jgi:DNA-binding XRE family transcriptional regulator
MSDLTNNFISEFQDKETRHIYADDFLNTWIATQLKVLREDKGWTQAQVAEETGMKQERISVLEDVNYESWRVSVHSSRLGFERDNIASGSAISGRLMMPFARASFIRSIRLQATIH